MTEAQEFNLKKRKVTEEDLENIVTILKPGSECIITLSNADDASQDFDRLKPLLKKIIKISSRVILIAAPGFEALVDQSDKRKIFFISKPPFNYEKINEKDFDSILNSLIEIFWEHFFPKSQRVKHTKEFTSTAQAAVEVYRANSTYLLTLKMSQEGLKACGDKILQFPKEGIKNYPPSDLVAEVLNLFCGLLRPILRENKLNQEIQIGIPEELSSQNEMAKGPTLYRWSFEIDHKLNFELELNEEVNHVST
jgi:hypothetical protein